MDYRPYLDDLPEGAPGFATCFAFSVHKSGSTLLHAMLAAVCRQANLPGASIPDMLFNHGIFEADWYKDADILPYFRRNMLYFGFRALPDILLGPAYDLRSKPFVLLVRDPRDALVSQYFSYGKKSGSHKRPEKNPAAFKKLLQAEEMSIDTYVRQAAPGLLRKLEAYRQNLDFGNGLLRRYEDIFFDKEAMLRDSFAHFGISVDPAILAAVAQKFDIRPEKEDETQHIRKGTPGDHAEKLVPETIAHLNEVFRETGAFYGYRL